LFVIFAVVFVVLEGDFKSEFMTEIGNLKMILPGFHINIITLVMVDFMHHLGLQLFKH
jgi:hypothetical protein